MYRFCILLVFAGSLGLSGEAQPLYMPRNIARAYAKGTRSMDGFPGKRYWQNRGIYDITLTVMPPDRIIRGSEQITYLNNSPDTLKNIAFRLILNIHKPGAGRIGGTDSLYLTPGLQIDGFTENGVARNWRSPRGPLTAQLMRLSKPLMPGDSVRFSFNWHYLISQQSNREGMIDSTSYYLAYFYPRVSVYDDYNGWDLLDFTDQQEFYNDFNDYSLTVHVPKNYLVWATGDLQNAEEVLAPEYAGRLKLSLQSDSIIHVADAKDLAAGNITLQQELLSWKWKAGNVSDLAIGLSNHYVWDASSVVVDRVSGRRASVQAAFLDRAADFHQSVKNARFALDWYSQNWPGVPYPYSKMTAFQGFADMEYPMMVNDASNSNLVFSRLVQDHEIAHTYFPFYMGINESRYAFMDEGWATTLELLIGSAEMSPEAASNFYKNFRVEGWIKDKSSEEDIPIITPANVLNGAAYGNNAYGKASLGYLALKDMLGDDLFRKCLHEYMSRWHGKHPLPWDFFNSFNNAAGRDLNWFWNNWYFSNYYIDLAIGSASKTKKGYSVIIQNIGGFVAPFDLKISYADGSMETVHKSPEIWKANQKSVVVDIPTGKKIRSLKLDGGIFMDEDESNNNWTAKD